MSIDIGSLDCGLRMRHVGRETGSDLLSRILTVYLVVVSGHQFVCLTITLRFALRGV